jgi:predicted small lipoprotein YifL
MSKAGHVLSVLAILVTLAGCGGAGKRIPGERGDG